MLRFEYPYSYDYRIPVTPQLGSGVGVYFPSFPPNATVVNGDGSDSEQSSFDDFNNNNFNNDDNNNNNMIMNDNNDNNNSNNNERINEEPSLLSDSLPADNPSSEYYANTPLFSPKTINAANDYNTTTPNHRNSISISAPSDDLSEFVMGEGGNESKPELVSDLTEFPAVDLLPPPMTTLPPLPVGTAYAPSESDDEELFRAKKQKPSNDTVAPKKSTARRGRKSAAAEAAEAAQAAVTATASVTSSSSSVSSVTVVGAPSENHRKTSTGSDEDNDHSDSPHSSHHSSSDHYRTKHSISETRRRTRLRNQFKYLAEASASAKTDRYSVLCAAIVKIEAAKRRIAELESQLAAATVGRSGLSPMPAVSSAPSAMCCAESIEYGVCSQCSGVATALLSGDGVGTFLSANHRWLSLIGVNSLPELQSVAPSFLKVVGTSTAEVSSARSTLSAVSAHKHGSMTLPLDSNTILAYKNHSDSSIEPALLYANIRHFPTKSSRPALFTLSSYEHGAADNRNPCVIVTAVPCEPLPEGVTVSSYNDRLAHRGRKAGGGHISPPLSDSSSSSTLNNNGTGKKEGKKRSYSQRVARSNVGEGEGMNARIGNHLMIDESL